MPITLTVVTGPHSGQTFTFNRYERFLVGRSPRAHFRLRSEQDRIRRVSRLHFLIEVNPPLCRLYDLGSHNGTFVNGQRIAIHDLHHGNEIKVAHTVLRIAVSDDVVEETQAWSLGKVLGLLPQRQAPPAPVPPPHLPLGLCVCCNTTPAQPTEPVCPACRERGQQLPQPIPGYLLLRELGRDSMGELHLGLREADQALLTLRIIEPAGTVRSGLIDRFLHDAHALRVLEHPYIVAYRDLGMTEKRICVGTDYVSGPSVRQLIQERGPLSVRSAVRIASQLLQGVEYAHARKLFHRDIRPDNVLLEIDGQRMTVKLAEFGLARSLQTSQLGGLTLERDMASTLPFLPPEFITNVNEVFPSADQYAAAATLYYLLTGHGIRDLNGGLAGQVNTILKDEAVPILNRRPDLPPELAEVIHRALDSEPHKRFGNVLQLRLALRPFAT